MSTDGALRRLEFVGGPHGRGWEITDLDTGRRLENIVERFRISSAAGEVTRVQLDVIPRELHVRVRAFREPDFALRPDEPLTDWWARVRAAALTAL